MTENIAMLLVNGFSLLIILAFQILIPSISRKNILLGVKIPENKIKTDEVKNIVKSYIRENLIIGITGIVLITLFLNQYTDVIFLTLSPIIYLIILFLIYLRWNKKLKDLKSEKEWRKLSENTITINTKFSRDKGKDMGISRKWYLIPFIMIIINIALSLMVYPSLPSKVPTHWDFSGNIDGYMEKSMLVALMIPLFQLGMLILIFFINYTISKSKQQIDGKNPEQSLRKSIIFRRVWSIYLVFILILLELLLTVANMMILGLLDNIRIQNTISFVILSIIIILSFSISLKLGQGGDKIKIDGVEEVNTRYDIDDDSLWKIGNSIYYNPEDSSLFVEKRIGVGWTVNGGRPLGMFLLILPFIIIVITLFIVK